MIDRYTEQLELVGFTKQQAKVQVSILDETIKKLATKDDLRETKDDLKETLKLYATKADLERLELTAEKRALQIEGAIGKLTSTVDLFQAKLERKEYRMMLEASVFLVATATAIKLIFGVL